MSKTLLALLLALAFPLAALADHHDESCEARANRVTEDLQREAETPLSDSEVVIARRAALASCREEPGERVAQAEPTQGGVGRFFSGLFSMDSPPAKKRAGKYRYIEKD